MEYGNPKEESERFGFVLTSNTSFIECSNGLAYEKTIGYSDWFFLSDLFIEKPYRKKGYGAELLNKLERKVLGLGISFIYTWTAEYEAPGFYEHQGYSRFFEMTNWYSTGHSKIGYQKNLVSCQ